MTGAAAAGSEGDNVGATREIGKAPAATGTAVTGARRAPGVATAASARVHAGPGTAMMSAAATTAAMAFIKVGRLRIGAV